MTSAPVTTTISAPSPRVWTRSAQAQRELHALVPGGAHTYARGSDQYPENMAPVIARGVGARVEDVDGNWFVEYGMGLRAVTLGYGYAPVVEAVSKAAARGTAFSRPSILELEAAREFLSHVPGADMVKFAKNGSDVTTAAVKLARAKTQRDMVAVCGTQPFFSVDDWFITLSQMDAGVSAGSREATVTFRYNDLESVQELLERYPDRIAAFILEPATATAEPAPGFLEGLRRLTREHGCVLIFDEMITGLRWSLSGAQSVYGVTPDLSTWGKAMGNGFPISALAGRGDLMEQGGLNTDDPRVFLLSTTHGSETTGLAAYLAVAEAYVSRDVVGIMESQGRKLAEGMTRAAEAAGVQEHVIVMGRPSCLVFGTKDHEGNPSQAFRTLFIQEMLERGVLGQSLVVSAAHSDEDIAATVEAAAGSFETYARALRAGSTDGLLRGRPVAPAMRALAHPRRLPDSPIQEA